MSVPPESSPPLDEDAGERRFHLDELAALAGVSARTVRFYIQNGLLARPEGAKRGSYYLARHLEALLRIRRWSDAGLGLDRIRELVGGALDDPPPRKVAPGTVEVWSRVTIADGFEVHIEPGRAGLTPEQLRHMVRLMTEAYRTVRAAADDPIKGPHSLIEDPNQGVAS
jgi:DNA-binding transcriptional MerR regulator